MKTAITNYWNNEVLLPTWQAMADDVSKMNGKREVSFHRRLILDEYSPSYHSRIARAKSMAANFGTCCKDSMY